MNFEIRDLNYNIGLRNLFDDASLIVGDGQKIGLVGVNGSGKTTLFRIMQGQIHPDSGEITLPKSANIVSIKQEIENTDTTVLDYVLQADKELQKLEHELTTNPAPERIAAVYERLMDIGAASAGARASAILAGLGFSNEDLKKPLSEFSGGWRMRAALAGALFAPSDLLLLDEPTNHLDLETTIWLENFLEKSDRTIIIISHDRHILNKVCDKIAHLENNKIKLYNGNYDTFERTREIEKENAAAALKKYTERKEHLQSFVDRFRYKASKAAQAQSRIKMIEKMGDAPAQITDPDVQFNFPSPEALPPYLIMIENAEAGYEDKVVLKNLNLALSQDDRIALVGANGNGKSTLAKVLAGKLPLMTGKATKSRKLRVAYFAQHQTEELDVKKTPYEIMSGHMWSSKESEVRAHLGGFGLNKAKSDTLVGNISGGEKARLMLALITKDKPHILILDEPTNHLDIVSRTALLEALNKYEGAVILITHDMHLIDLVCDRLWLIHGGECHHFSGDTADYRQKIINGTLLQTVAKEKAKKENNKEREAERKALAAPIKKEIKELENKIEKETREKELLEADLIVNFSGEKSIKLAGVNNHLEDLEARWVALQEKLEKI